MNWLIKTAQVKLEEGQDTRTGAKIYYVSGNTYPIRTQLGRGGLGFRWYNAKKFWWMPENQMNDSVIKGLQNLGVNVSLMSNAESNPVAQPELNPQTQQPNQTQPNIKQDITESLINNSPADEPEDKIPFPIKENIYSESLLVEILGQPIELKLQLNRKAKEGKGSDRYRKTYPMPWRKYPQYTVDVIFNNERVSRLAIMFNREGGIKPINAKPYHMINEDVDILPLFKELKDKIPEVLENPQNKLRQKLEYELHMSQRSPDLTAYLQKIDENNEAIEKTVYINHPKFPNEYAIKLEPYSNGNSFHISTALKHPSAPRPEFITIEMLPETVKTIDEFNQWINQILQEPQVAERIQKKYIEYIDSFAFTDEEAEQEKQNLNDIVSLIQNKSMDFEHYRQKLISLGYVRPHKRQKNYGPGMVPQDAIKWIVDTKKILSDGFYGDNKRFASSPEFFYALIAYHMHRFKAGTSDHVGAIQSNIIQFSGTLKRYGIDISWKDLANYTETIANQLVEEITGSRAPNTAWDNYQQFYGGNYGGTGTETGGIGQARGLQNFVNLAVGLGVDPERAKTNPKGVFRELSMKYHTDLNPSADPSIMVELNTAYEQVPHELRAENLTWLQKIAGDKKILKWL